MLSADISVGTCTEDMARTSKREASKKHLGNICKANWAVTDSIVTYKDWQPLTKVFFRTRSKQMFGLLGLTTMNYHTRQSKDLEESNRYAGHCTTKTKKVDSKVTSQSSQTLKKISSQDIVQRNDDIFFGPPLQKTYSKHLGKRN